MYQRIKIEGYRSFPHFELESLGRINLIVGSNGSGKTSILEAVYLVAEGARISLGEVACGRGELKLSEASVSQIGRTYLQDIRHLFYGREFKPDERILLFAETNDHSSDYVTLTVVRKEHETGPQKGDGFPVLQLRSLSGSEPHERAVGVAQELSGEENDSRSLKVAGDRVGSKNANSRRKHRYF